MHSFTPFAIAALHASAVFLLSLVLLLSSVPSMSRNSTLMSECSRVFPGRSPVVGRYTGEGSEVSAGRSRGSGVEGLAAKGRHEQFRP